MRNGSRAARSIEIDGDMVRFMVELSTGSCNFLVLFHGWAIYTTNGNHSLLVVFLLNFFVFCVG